MQRVTVAIKKMCLSWTVGCAAYGRHQNPNYKNDQCQTLITTWNLTMVCFNPNAVSLLPVLKTITVEVRAKDILLTMTSLYVLDLGIEIIVINQQTTGNNLPTNVLLVGKICQDEPQISTFAIILFLSKRRNDRVSKMLSQSKKILWNPGRKTNPSIFYLFPVLKKWKDIWISKKNREKTSKRWFFGTHRKLLMISLADWYTYCVYCRVHNICPCMALATAVNLCHWKYSSFGLPSPSRNDFGQWNFRVK